MANTYFRLGITVTGDKLATVIDVLNREGVDLKVEQIEAPANGVPIRKTKQFKATDGRGAFDVVKDFLAGRPGKDVYAHLIENELKARGFAPSTCYASLATLIKDGSLAKLGKGKYRWIKK